MFLPKYIYLCEVMEEPYCGNHFAIYMCDTYKVITLYTLNLHMLHVNCISVKLEKSGWERQTSIGGENQVLLQKISHSGSRIPGS